MPAPPSTIRGYRTRPIISDHINAVVSLLTTFAATDAPSLQVGEWERPLDGEQKYIDPPYLLVRNFPSADETSGPISDSQVDVRLRVQVMGIGHTQNEATNVCDWARPRLQRSLLEPLIPNRAVMDFRMMVVSGGATRDNDLIIPMFYAHDIYEMWTTPQSTPPPGP